ncbi:unnamed protein product [Darwinula stevensoni]|uniref:Sushi domain-containing protein n=1 Tax=Darwinula stevensoni TaxID=69355 RepID=A0A7R9ADB6_9CRUS|nr:unnamed protein product [Darwinula stevensoni]CAG0901159.1 unnamed protein product [Darwinula stevensoni]
MGDLNGAGTPTKDIHGASGLRCGLPGQPANGWIINKATFYFYRGLTTYQCADGFVLFGSSQRMCLENGMWNGTVPTCEFDLAHGKASQQSLTLMNYRSDLAVDGDPETCSYTQRNKKSSRWWLVNLGRRYNVTYVGIRIERGTYQAFTVFVMDVQEEKPALYQECVRFSGTFPLETMMFRCNRALGTTGQIVYIRDERQTEEHLRLCEVQVFASQEWMPCGDPEQPIYSSVNWTENQAHYSCLPGFTLKGETVRNCLADGQWSSSPPTCVADPWRISTKSYARTPGFIHGPKTQWPSHRYKQHTLFPSLYTSPRTTLGVPFHPAEVWMISSPV